MLASLPLDAPQVKRIRDILLSHQPKPIAQQPEPAPQSAQIEEAQSIALLRHGAHFLVKSKVNNTGLKLLIDTGATTTSISEDVLDKIKRGGEYRLLGNYTINTAAGQIEAPVYRIKSLQVGDYQVTNLAIIVLPNSNLGGANGLLGMNFLREFEFRIDQQKSRLYLQ